MKHPRGIAFWPLTAQHVCVTMWRHCTGRWFIFRDRPTWFVATVAAESRKPDPDEDLANFARKAREELRLRHRQQRVAGVVS